MPAREIMNHPSLVEQLHWNSIDRCCPELNQKKELSDTKEKLIMVTKWPTFFLSFLFSFFFFLEIQNHLSHANDIHSVDKVRIFNGILLLFFLLCYAFYRERVFIRKQLNIVYKQNHFAHPATAIFPKKMLQARANYCAFCPFSFIPFMLVVWMNGKKVRHFIELKRRWWFCCC